MPSPNMCACLALVQSFHALYYLFLFVLGCFNSLPSLVSLDLSLFRLASFGGAGGQHATEIARLLGISKILIHRHSSILSAYGLALADRYAFHLLSCVARVVISLTLSTTLLVLL